MTPETSKRFEEVIESLVEESLEIYRKAQNQEMLWSAAWQQTNTAKAAAVSACARIAEEGKWVSVEERLPGKDELCLAYHVNYGRRLGQERRGIVIGDWDDEVNATHWMPLPPPPGGEGEKGTEK